MLGQDAQRAIKINFLLTQWIKQSKYYFLWVKFQLVRRKYVWWSNNDVINKYIEQELT